VKRAERPRVEPFHQGVQVFVRGKKVWVRHAPQRDVDKLA
jgi:hypothetical protein